MATTITSINHATLLLETAGGTVLTDPVFSRTIGLIIPRLRRAGRTLSELPPIDFVLISHDHHDHLNLKSLRALRRRSAAALVVPEGLGRYGRRTGFADVRELPPDGETGSAALMITRVPARHGGKRLPWQRSAERFAGYIIDDGTTTVYFAGDTAYGPHFAEIGKRFAIDAAILPIGAYKPYSWFENIHLNPRTAMQAFMDLNAAVLIPMHWGTFKISDEPLDEPPAWLLREARERGLEDRIRLLPNGESLRIEGRDFNNNPASRVLA